MASLEELKKRLYREKETFGERAHAPELARPGKPRQFSWLEKDETASASLKQRYFWIWVAVLFVLISASGFYLLNSQFLEAREIEVKISGARELQSGERTRWEVRVTNRSRRDISDATLVFNFPDDASPVEKPKPKGIFRERKALGNIKSGESVSESFDAIVFGGRNSQREVSAVLEYRPEGASAVFGAEESFSFSIVRSPVSLTIAVPKELRIGQEMKFEINYASQSADELNNLILEAKFPEGFKFLSSRPALRQDKGFVWEVKTVKPSQTGKIEIRGIITGSKLESKVFSATFGRFDEQSSKILAYEETAETVILKAPFLEAKVLANGLENYITSPGDTITFQVFWQNNLESEVRDAVLEVKLSGGAVDFRSIKIERGVLLEQTKAITWNASTYEPFKVLPPGASGKLEFSFKTKSSFPLDSSSSRPQISLNTLFKSASPVPGFEDVDITGSSVLDIKMSSKLQLAARAVYFNSAIPNSGPIPPKAGEETTYTITLSLANMTNDLGGIVVKSSFPPYVNFKEIVSPADANIVFNRNSGEIEWRVGALPAGTGFLRPALQVAFQVGLIPAQNQIGSAPIIINLSEATGRDTYTEQTLSSQDGHITTELPDDPNASFDKRVVVP